MNAFARHGLAVACLSLCLSFQLARAQQDLADDQDATAYTYPVVITPTRLKQSLADVPGSVTIIAGDTLRQQGIQSVADALRLVPGMAVTVATGTDTRVNYHGTNIVAPRRMNVLVDGFAAYGTTLSRADWSTLPVALENIDRIEVSRGPDSAAYGPNSMMAVINIITLDPRDVGKALVAVGAGSHHTVDATARFSTRPSESTHMAITFDTVRQSGYDDIVLPLPLGDHDSSKVHQGNLRTRTALDSHTSLELFANVTEAYKESPSAGDPQQRTYPDITQRGANLAMRWTQALSSSHEVQVRALGMSSVARQDWATCTWAFMLNPTVVEVINRYPQVAGTVTHGADPRNLLPGGDVSASTLMALMNTFSAADLAKLSSALIEMGGPAAALQTVCGQTNNNLDESRAQVEVQDTLVISDQFRLVSGAGLKRQRAYADVLLSGAVNSTVRWAFAHGEYRVLPTVTLNAGGYYESNSLSGDTFAPMAAANIHLTDEQTIRLVYSRGSRSPDALEVKGNWAPVVDNMSPPQGGATSGRTFALLRGNPALTEERNTSVELGHMLALRRWGMVVDSRVFRDALTDVITNYSNYDQLSPNNDTHLKLAGAESQVNWSGSGDWSGWLTYAYLVNYDASNEVERTQWSRHSGSLGLSRRLGDHWQAGVATYHASADGFRQSSYGRSDLTLTHKTRLDGTDVSSSLTLSYLHTPSVRTYMGWSSGSFLSSYHSPLGVYAKVRIGF